MFKLNDKIVAINTNELGTITEVLHDSVIVIYDDWGEEEPYSYNLDGTHIEDDNYVLIRKLTKLDKALK